MRYIRDIIKEQQGEQNTALSRAEHSADDLSKPLSLENPMFPEGEPVKQGNYEDDKAGAGPMIEPQAAENTLETALAFSSGSDGHEAAWHDQPSDMDEAHGDDFQDGSFEEDTNSTATLDTAHDPFDRLRHSEEQPARSRPTVSALRTTPTLKAAQTKLAAPVTPPAPQAAHPTLEDMTPLADALEPAPIPAPGPVASGNAARSGRVRTRLLGFSAGAITDDDPFEKNKTSGSEFPVGWLVVVSELGRGAAFSLHDGVSTVGRGTDQTVCLDFGDNSVSRENHISIAFDAEQKKFFVGHGGKANLVRLNNKPLLSTEELNSTDLIRVGETTLRFIAFCDNGFSWADAEDGAMQRA